MFSLCSFSVLPASKCIDGARSGMPERGLASFVDLSRVHLGELLFCLALLMARASGSERIVTSENLDLDSVRASAKAVR